MQRSKFAPRLIIRIFAIAFMFVFLAAISWQGLIASAAPSIGNPSDPCYTTVLLTVRQASRIYYAPDVKATTAYSLQAGSKFFVCTNSKLIGWAAFRLTNRTPTLYVPTGIFG